jgi:hypothetical protein
MTFGDAMQKVADGAEVSRVEWAAKDEFLFLHPESRVLSIHHNEHHPDPKLAGQSTPLMVSEGDMVAKDWIVVYPRG